MTIATQGGTAIGKINYTYCENMCVGRERGETGRERKREGEGEGESLRDRERSRERGIKSWSSLWLVMHFSL